MSDRDWQKDMELAKKATPGPWRAEVYARRVMPYICDHVDPADARFIATAREGWPAALEERARLEERVKELEAQAAVMREALKQAGEALLDPAYYTTTPDWIINACSGDTKKDADKIAEALNKKEANNR